VTGRIAGVSRAAAGVPVLAVSSLTGDGLDRVQALLVAGRTAILLGSSGVGKSTLLNRLTGSDVMPTRAVRSDGRGRHTTRAGSSSACHGAPCSSIRRPPRAAAVGRRGGPGPALRGRRQLEVRPKRQTDLRRPCTPSPGLASAVLGHALEGAPSGPRRRPRIWGTWTTNLSPAFPARPLAARCRFADCSHSVEPGCAVRAAVEQGELSVARLASYRQLSREAAGAEQRAAHRRDRRAALGRRQRLARLREEDSRA
jgi:ribosome biogenesis GTPase / thiamine phosphate phosphatase